MNTKTIKLIEDIETMVETVEDLYKRTGTQTRRGDGLFALRQDLLVQAMDGDRHSMLVAEEPTGEVWDPKAGAWVPAPTPTPALSAETFTAPGIKEKLRALGINPLEAFDAMIREVIEADEENQVQEASQSDDIEWLRSTLLSAHEERGMLRRELAEIRMAAGRSKGSSK